MILYLVALNVRHVQMVGDVLGDGALSTSGRACNQPDMVVPGCKRCTPLSGR